MCRHSGTTDRKIPAILIASMSILCHIKQLSRLPLAIIMLMAGYVVLGIGFGILLKDAGYGLFWSFLMSLTIYAGSMQFALISLLPAATPLPGTTVPVKVPS